MLSSVCFAKNVFVKPTRSAIGLFVASAHQLVNSKLFDVFRLFRPPVCSATCSSRVVLE
jgi:hypothetical protein